MSDFNFAIVLDNDDQVAVTHSALGASFVKNCAKLQGGLGPFARSE